MKSAYKTLLVQRLAVWDTPSEAATALKAECGLEISPQRAEAYDPTKRAGRRLSRPLRELFEATRKRFLAELGDLPAANKAVRVRRLERMSVNAEGKGNYVLAAALLKQIAEEVGNV